MKPWKRIGQTNTPDGKTISLDEHDGSYYICVENNVLMSTRQHFSEEELARLACAPLQRVRGARVLIGGLGFGFTLRAALSSLAPDAKVVVAEILAPVIEWNRDRSLPLAADAMADSRVTIEQRDVAELIRSSPRAFDGILLDVDNGPAAIGARGNQRLYNLAGLRQTLAALRPGGCAAFWAAAPDPGFARLMERAGFAVELHHSRARANAGATHTIFLGRAR